MNQTLHSSFPRQLLLSVWAMIWLLACQPSLPAQVETEIPTTCSEKNRSSLEGHLQALSQEDWSDVPLSDIVIAVGKRFMGTPYVAKTLELPGEEKLVVELQGLDCTTFLENVVVLSRLAKQGRLTFADFQEELVDFRYRDGEMNGYPSRLHYFSEWISHHAEQGLVRDITAEIGGIPYDKPLNFMSTHRDAYAQLATDDQALAAMQVIEQQLNTRKLQYLPKAKVAAQETLIHSGDLIAITTSIKGLDVVHVGLALQHQGRLHLFHASTGGNKVVISEKPLAEYLAGIKHQSGIMVCRLVE